MRAAALYLNRLKLEGLLFQILGKEGRYLFQGQTNLRGVGFQIVARCSFMFVQCTTHRHVKTHLNGFNICFNMCLTQLLNQMSGAFEHVVQHC